ncbi:MAG TPA: zinc ribbon domain-containing protein [Gemmatales bacterium]|nr:zinc ribbon domain-containing protein [Gemmatales bacterium]
MPTYQYQCSACQHGFEELQSIKDEPLTKCPKCKKKKLQRLIGTGAGLLFKGSGFYITDYRSDSYKSAAKAEGGSSSKSEGSSSSSSDKGGKTGKSSSKGSSD